MKLVNTTAWNDGEEEMNYTYQVSSLPLWGAGSENLNINNASTDSLQNQDKENHQGVKNNSSMDELQLSLSGGRVAIRSNMQISISSEPEGNWVKPRNSPGGKLNILMQILIDVHHYLLHPMKVTFHVGRQRRITVLWADKLFGWWRGARNEPRQWRRAPSSAMRSRMLYLIWSPPHRGRAGLHATFHFTDVKTETDEN